MLINEVMRKTNLTKKAIEYYNEQDLIHPKILQNGYKDYAQKDIDRLDKIYVLRKLGISINEIREILEDKTNSSLQKTLLKKELENTRKIKKESILKELIDNKSYIDIKKELQIIEKEENILEKLLEAFPGYYGRFICIHFSRFLNEKIITKEKEEAYNKIILFLDNLPSLNIPSDLEEYLDKNTDFINTSKINEIIQSMSNAYDNPEEFLKNNEDNLKEYMIFKESEEYKNHPAAKLANIIKEFNSSFGYNDVFIPNMRILSSSYNEYYKKVEAANKIYLEKFIENK